MIGIGQLWTTMILEPMINLLVLLYSLLFSVSVRDLIKVLDPVFGFLLSHF